MKIRWLGHAAFVLTTEQGQVILTDPYEPNCYGGALRYSKITVNSNVVTLSHDHADHACAASALKGKPQVIDRAGDYEISGVKIKGIPSFHDANNGKERGKNIIFTHQTDGLTVAHLGDLGHIPSQGQYEQIGLVDVLLAPVGGHFTIDATQATEIAQNLKAKVVIPMHYKTEQIDFPIAPVDGFLKGKKVKKISEAEVTIDKNNLPGEQEIWVLPYS